MIHTHIYYATQFIYSIILFEFKMYILWTLINALWVQRKFDANSK